MDDFSIYNPALQGKTLEDLFFAIKADVALDAARKQQVINEIHGMTGGMSASTPISALMLRGLGGMVGWLISKYFGMGPVGQLVSTVSGFGLGAALSNHLGKPPTPYPGWRIL